ncbi:ParB N-terminal domain-containing protein [bacterium]|nr:ParB N-terminal domain-containing protein [bacterium]
MKNQIKKIGERNIPIRDIKIGERYRDDLGDLSGLQLSLEIHGQLQPIIVQEGDNGYELIDGERRIQTFKRMGLKEIWAQELEAMDNIKRREIELELCIKRKSLSYAEESRAVRDIVEARKKQGSVGGIAKFGGTIRNKDIAETLGMSPATLSQCLTIANALDDHPEIELMCTSKTKALKMISRKEFIQPAASLTRKHFEESYTIQTPLSLVEGIDGSIVDLALLHPDTVDRELVRATVDRLRIGGSLILFVEMTDIGEWMPFLLSIDGLNVETQPMIWNVKGESDYRTYFWCGKGRSSPIRIIPPHVTYPRSPESLHLKAKAPMLIRRFVQSCTETGGFIISPGCWDIDTVKVAHDMQRNIRACTTEQILRDKLIMTSGR